MRNFEAFLDFCHDNIGNYHYLAFDGSFERILNYPRHNRQGHYIQLFYAIYDFYSLRPEFISQAGIPAFDIRENQIFFDRWYDFIHDESNDAIGFSTESLRKNLSSACGGHRVGGGAWSPIAKILFPTVAIYMIR